MDVGRITARLDAILDDSAFDKFDRKLDTARREAKRDVKAQLRGDADLREIDKFERKIDGARRDARTPIHAKADVDVDTRGLDKYNRALKDTDRGNSDFVRGSGRVKGAFGSLFFGGAGVAAGAGALYGLGKATKYVLDAFGESETSAAQVAQVIKSTGGAANVSAKDVDELSTSISKKTGIDDEAIASGQALLLTFTNVRNETGKGNDIFTQATKTAADMSTALGQDLTSSNIQLGKALNDPIKGITALSRVGVSFTKGQKDQIKSLVDSGHTLDAQKIILRELNKEFGGSAEAAGKTLPGSFNRMKVAVGNVAEELGGKLAPYAEKAANFITDLANGGGKGSKALDTLKSAAKTAGAIIGDVFDAIKTVIDDSKDSFADIGNTAKKHFDKIKGAVESIAASFKKTFGGNTGFVSDLRNIIRVVISFGATVASVGQAIAQRALPGIITAFKGFFQVIRGIVRIISGIFSGDFSKVWKGIKDIFAGGIKLVLGQFRAMTAPVRALLSALGGVFKSGFHKVVGFFEDLASDGWKALKKLLSNTARWASNLVSAGVDAGKRFASKVLNFFRDLPGDVWNALKRIVSRVVSFEGDLISAGANAAKGFANKIIDYVTALPGNFASGLKNIITKVVSFEGDLVSKGATLAKNFVGKIVDGIGALPGKISGVFGRVLDFMKGIPGKMIGIFKGIGSSLAGAIKDAANKLIPDSIGFGPKKVAGKTVIPRVEIKIPQLLRGGRVGPSMRGAELFVAGEGDKDEWVISQEGDRGANISWAKQALETLTGKRVQFHRGGTHKKKKKPIPRHSVASVIGKTASRSISRGETGIKDFERDIQRYEREYSQAERTFNLSEEEIIVENDDGSVSINQENLAKRSGEIQDLITKRERIKKLIEDYQKTLAGLVTTYQKAVAKLTKALKAAKGKLNPKDRVAYKAEIEEYTARIGEIQDLGRDLDLDIQDQKIDIDELNNEKDALDGKPGAGDASKSADPTGNTFGGDYLTSAEDATLGGLLEAQATAGTTADTADDASTANAIRDFYSGVLARGGLTQAQRIDILGQIGLPAVDAGIDTGTGGSGGTTPVDPSTPTGTPSPTDIATAALAALDQLQSSRSDLLGQFGSNFTRAGIGANSGLPRFFGAAPNGQPSSIGQAAGGGVTINQHFDAPPPDEHSWTRGVDFELRAAV